MKNILLCSLLLPLASISGICEEASDDLKIPTFYLKSYDGYEVKTTNPEITIFTKTNPFTAKDDELIQGSVIFSPKLSAIEGWNVIIDLYELNTKKGYPNKIADFVAKVSEYTYEDSKVTTKRVSICIKAKYFSNAVIRYSNDEEVEAELHLCKPMPVKAEQSGVE